jgi:hypothetical protein
MATSSFFYGGSSAPEQNTVDELIDTLNQKVAETDLDRVAAEQARDRAETAASNAELSESNVAGLAQQAQEALTEASTSVTQAANSASSAAASASTASTQASNASTSATNAATSASSAATSATAASTSASSAAASAAASSASAAAASSTVSSLADPSGSSLVGFQPVGVGAVATAVQSKLRESVSVVDFGADPTGVADSTAAIQLAVNHLNTVSATQPCTLVFPSGSYLVSNEIDFTATGGQRRHVIGGDGFETARIRVNFPGYDKYVFKLGNPASPAYQRTISIEGFFFERVNTSVRAPVGIGGNAISQSRISNVFFGSWDNSTIQLYAPQNCRFENITFFGGGRAWDYKLTTGITVQQNGSTLTASGSLFSASDVGHTVALWGPAPNFGRRKTKITGYTSPTQVTVDTSYVDAVAFNIYFGSPLVSMTSGSATLTADASCFAATDVGIVVYVKGARANGRLLRATISAYVSPTQVTLSEAAGTSVTNVEFATPALDLHSYTADSGAGGSDNSFANLQIESHRGIAAVVQNQDQLSFSATKFHGLQTISSNGRYAMTPMWLDQASGFFQGSFDAQYIGEEKLFATYLSSPFNFEALTVRAAYDEKLLRVGLTAPGFEGGVVNLGTVSLLGVAPNTTSYSQLITDANTPIPGYALTGRLSANNIDLTQVHTGNRLYADSRGQAYFEDTNGIMPLVRLGDRGTGPTGGSLNPADITWNGTAPSGTAALQYRWQRIGNMVFFDFRLNYAVAGVTNSSLIILLPTDMPAPLFFNTIGANHLSFSFAGGLATAATAAPSLTRTWLKNSSPRIEIGMVLNSGSIAATHATGTGMYWTAG